VPRDVLDVDGVEVDGLALCCGLSHEISGVNHGV
jgi:hypothetical protein